MKSYHLLIAVLFASPLIAEQPITRIGFGSCIHQDRDPKILDAVLESRPEVFVFLGDNLYGDTVDMEVMRSKYVKQMGKPRFQRLRSEARLLATWDDHDYGANDMGREYPRKVESQRLFEEFWQVPEDDPSRSTPGIYRSVTMGPEGRRVQFLLLDTRYFRTALGDTVARWREQRRPGPYTRVTDPGATVLGDAQWEWLAAELKRPAELRVIASSIQVIPEEHFWESWANFPAERLRLFELLEPVGEPVVFLSGDRHMGEISVLPADDPQGAKRTLWEVTSSGLTQAGGGYNEPNRFRVGGEDAFRSRNFGLLTLDWTQTPVGLLMELRDVDGAVVSRYRPE